MKSFFYLSLFFAITLLQAQESLTATIVGSGSPKYDKKRASACVLIQKGDTKILLDMGNGTQANLNALGIDTRSLSALMFTHHHLDHNEEFVPLLIRSLLGKQTFSIIGPPDTVKLTNTNLDLYEKDINYRLGKRNRTLEQRKQSLSVRDIQGGETFAIGEVKVSTIMVPHTIHAIAYRFDDGDTSIVVTGDLTYSKELSKLAQNADFMIIDSGGMIMSNQGKKGKKKRTGKKAKGKGKNSKREKAHLNLDESSLIAKEANIKTLVYTHFRSGTIDQEASLTSIRKNFQGKVVFAKDLMQIN